MFKHLFFLLTLGVLILTGCDQTVKPNDVQWRTWNDNLKIGMEWTHPAPDFHHRVAMVEANEKFNKYLVREDTGDSRVWFGDVYICVDVKTNKILSIWRG